jgi:hypothetical protein
LQIPYSKEYVNLQSMAISKEMASKSEFLLFPVSLEGTT